MKPKVFISVLIQPKYEYNQLNKWVEVEHGRNHLITSQWCEPLIGMRETTNDENGSKGMKTQSTSVNNETKFEHSQNHLIKGH